MKKRILLLLLTALFCPVARAQAPQQTLETTLKNLAQSKTEEAALQKKLHSVQREFEALQRRSAEIAARLQDTEQRVSNEENALAGANTRLGMKQREFEARKSDYTATVLSMLKMRQLPITALAANEEDTAQLMRTARVMQHTHLAIARKASALRRDLAQLKDLRSDANSRRTRTERETATLHAEQAKLEAALSERQRLQNDIKADHAKAEARVAQLSKESESLQALLGKLEKEGKKNAPPPSARVRPKAPEKFENAKGSLKLPVGGEILHRYGETKNGAEHYRGLTIRARTNATVTTPADGEVVFTGAFRDYGNMLLIKHDNNYITLVAGLGKITATLGQNVIQGEPVGTMPTSASPLAYLELRDANAKPIDPALWFTKVGSVSR